MTIEEFKIKMKEQEDWAPGWDAIEAEFERIYPGQEPAHYGTNMAARAMLGGNQYLDGYSIYTSPNGYKHIVTFGMSVLYTDEEAFGGEWSRWGYEMTMKLPTENNDDCMWAIDMLSNLARYTFTQKRFFEPFQFISGGGESLHVGTESAITALMTVPDTEAKPLDTIYGKVEFIQLVGITEPELDALKEDIENAKKLYELMKQDNPNLITDMGRIRSYL